MTLHRRAVRGRGAVFPEVYCCSNVFDWHLGSLPFTRGNTRCIIYLYSWLLPIQLEHCFRGFLTSSRQHNPVDLHRCGLGYVIFSTIGLKVEINVVLQGDRGKETTTDWWRLRGIPCAWPHWSGLTHQALRDAQNELKADSVLTKTLNRQGTFIAQWSEYSLSII